MVDKFNSNITFTTVNTAYVIYQSARSLLYKANYEVAWN